MAESSSTTTTGVKGVVDANALVAVETLKNDLRRHATNDSGDPSLVLSVALSFEDTTYVRFLRHHDFNSEKTAKALVEHAVSIQQNNLKHSFNKSLMRR